MNKEIAENCIKFLTRVTLQGNETPAFNQCVKALNDIINPPNEKKKGKASDSDS